MPAAFDPKRQALQAEVEAAVLSELERVGPDAFSKVVLVRRFADRGVSAPTLYRWIDGPLKSGRAGQHLVKKLQEAVTARAERSPEPAADAARQAVATLPAVVRADDIASAGGVVSTIQQLRGCIEAAQQVMAYARTEDGKVRIPKLLLVASEHLRRSLETAMQMQKSVCEVAQVETFNRAIMAELKRESPELAERVVVRLQHLSMQWSGTRT